MTDKYEKVTGMTIGQVIDAMMEGGDFYTLNSHDDYVTVDCEVDDIKEPLEGPYLYRKVEAAWWEKHIGGLVMVRDDSKSCVCRTFEKYSDSQHGKFIVDSEGSRWKHMRPLTLEEKDAIITEG